MNESAAVDSIKANYKPDDRLAVVIIDKRSGEVKQRLATAERIVQPDYQAWLRFENTQRREMYISPNTIRPGSLGGKRPMFSMCGTSTATSTTMQPRAL